MLRFYSDLNKLTDSLYKISYNKIFFIITLKIYKTFNIFIHVDRYSMLFYYTNYHLNLQLF
jgi:hypothetical protein